MLRGVAIAAVLLAAIGVAAWNAEPPRLLSIADAAIGGGAGTERVATAVAFGTTGQTLDVWRPSGAGKAPLPVLIFYYGGGWAHGDRGAYGFAARAFAKAGFVVVVPDYRKVPKVRFPAFVQDSAMAVKWTRDNVRRFGGDPERIALAGHSAGAYNAVMLAVDPRWLRAEGVNPGIVKAAVGLCGPYDFYPFEKKRSIEAMAGVRAPMFTQPIALVTRAAPPLLLVTASRDTQVRPYNAANMFRRVQAIGGRAKFVEYDGLTHEEVAMALSKPYRGRAPVLAESVAFLRRAMP